ncbi:hypothetical protein NHQ30_004312 [Ciborinia camelliae]|nr:hypothetical protein NHQ30_004312 [Ciborinia camelliae]
MEGGPLQVSYGNYRGDYVNALAKSFDRLGLKRLKGLNNGELLGYGTVALNIDPETQTRSTSKTSFLQQAMAMTIIKIYPHTLAKRLLLDKRKRVTEVLTAAMGQVDYDFVLSARKEVIVSAGVFRYPQLLIVSGIGAKKTLEELSIPIVSELEIVTERVSPFADSSQDQPYIRLTHQRQEEPLAANNAGELIASHVPSPNTNYMTFEAGILKPRSRGNVTITSADTILRPLVNLNVFYDPVDVKLAVQVLLRVRESVSIDPVRLKAFPLQLSEVRYKTQRPYRCIVWGITEQSKSTASTINEAKVSQPLCTAIRITLVDLFPQWDIVPKVSIGHSSGEIGAAYAAGLISAPEAILAASCRGHAVAEYLTPGSMLAVGLGLEEIEQHLPSELEDICIACKSSSNSIALSGKAEPIIQLQQILSSKSIFARELKTGRAYHSNHMNPVSSAYDVLLEDAFSVLSLDDLLWRRPKSQMVSSVTGELISGDNIPPGHWSVNLRQRVRFSTAVHEMISDKEFVDVKLVIEIDPHSALAGPLKQIFSARKLFRFTYASSTMQNKNDFDQLLGVAGSAFIAGCSFDLEELGGTAIFPAAGHISLAIKALLQIHETKGLSFEGITLRDVDIKTALVVPENDEGIETISGIEELSKGSMMSSFNFDRKIHEKPITNFSSAEDVLVVMDDGADTLFTWMSKNPTMFGAIKTVLTSGVRALWLTSGKGGRSPTAGMAEGLLRVIRSEQAAARIMLLDTDFRKDAQDLGRAIVSLLISADTKDSGKDPECWLHGGTLQICRIDPAEHLNKQDDHIQESPLFKGLPCRTELVDGSFLFEREHSHALIPENMVEIQILSSEFPSFEVAMSRSPSPTPQEAIESQIIMGMENKELAKSMVSADNLDAFWYNDIRLSYPSIY